MKLAVLRDLNKTVFLFLVLSLFILSCGGRKRYVQSQFIEIQYWGDIEPGSWIQIDDVKFYHKTNDISEDCTGQFYTHDLTAVNLDNESDSLYLPSTSFHQCLMDGWKPHKINRGDMATSLVLGLREFGQSESELSVESAYKNATNLYQLAQGKVILMRSDEKEIRVSTSDGYKASVKKVDSPLKQ